MPRSVMKVSAEIMPVIKDLLPAGVRRFGADRYIDGEVYDVTIQGRAVPKTDRVKMSVSLDLVDGAPVRTVEFEAVAG